MIILIPLGGVGKRFSDKGYKKPKPLINVLGHPILYRLLDSLNLKNVTKIVIPYNNNLSKFNFEAKLRKDYPDIKFSFYELQRNTDGAAHTIKLMLDVLNEQNINDEPIICLDGDNFYTCDIINLWNGSNSVFSFKDEGNEPVFSYLELENNSLQIKNIVEKNKISNYASTGAYGFNSWQQLLKYCNLIIEKGLRQKNEYYISGVIKSMISDNIQFTMKQIEKQNYICLGTPNFVRNFTSNYSRINQLLDYKLTKSKRYCFDLDNTLVTFPKVTGDYRTVEPIRHMIEFVRLLKSFDNTIIIHTARRMRTHSGNVGKVIADIGRITFDTLEKYDIVYDEIYFGKPQADFYIDDLGISAFDNLNKELGFYQQSIKPRNFNNINLDFKPIYKKSGLKLSGEIYYYQNIPNTLRDLFPNFFGSNDKKTMYEIEKINGVVVSHLFLDLDLDKENFLKILQTLDRIHKTNRDKTQQINIYENYSKKLVNRYNNFDYSKFKNHKHVFKTLNEQLLDYENKNKGQCGIIHGDPVFTNIIIDNFNKIKLIDMRGKQGDIETLYGDIFYDYAKVYQSLIGYDEIHEERKINNDYRDELIDIFEKFIIQKYSKDKLKYIRTITNSLLFSLIPLHDDYKCEHYYNLIKL
jgi:capsule biosynthesis phosphatase